MEQSSQERFMNDFSVSKDTDAPIFLKAGTVIFAQGKSTKYLYLIKKGEVRMLKYKGHGLDVIQIYSEKEILNEVAILTNEVSEFTAIAKTDVELVRIDQNEIITIINSSPKWIPNVFEMLCERLKQTQEIINKHSLDLEKDPRLLLNKEDEEKYLMALDNFILNNT